MILAKKITKLANDIKCHEKVTKQVMKDKTTFYYYCELKRGSEYIGGNDSERISEEQAMKIVSKLKNEEV